MNTSLCRRLISFCMCAAISINLAACVDVPKPVKNPKHVKSVKKPDSSAKNIKSAGEQEPLSSDIKDAASDSEITPIIEAPQPQLLLVLEYKNPGESDMRQSYTRIPYAVDNTEFQELLESLNQFSENKSVLHNIHMVDTGNKNSESAVLSPNKKLPAEEEIGIGLRLIRFFIDNRQRDAAYIMVDNTKKLLASLSGPDARKKGKQLSVELEALESDMRKTMPFTL